MQVQEPEYLAAGRDEIGVLTAGVAKFANAGIAQIALRLI
jgi:hypothetical protein